MTLLYNKARAKKVFNKEVVEQVNIWGKKDLMT